MLLTKKMESIQLGQRVEMTQKSLKTTENIHSLLKEIARRDNRPIAWVLAQAIYNLAKLKKIKIEK